MTDTKNPIEALTIKGFKSIRNLDSFKLHSLNVLIGANGTGKSNFISYFSMLGELVEGRLQHWVAQQGGANRVLSYGVKETSKLESIIRFGRKGYKFMLQPTIDDSFSFADEVIFFVSENYQNNDWSLGSDHNESKLKEEYQEPAQTILEDDYYTHITNWKVYHFHDTSDTAGMKRKGALHDNDYLRPDASNLAAFLYKLIITSPDTYQQIRKTVALVIPFFDDFVLKPQALPTGEEQITLLWRQKDSDYPFHPSQLSDGSIRLICLVVALLQPDAPSTIIIDEPELGLHPYAITVLGALIRSASKRMQVIVSTQSVQLVNEFSIEDLIIVEREKGDTIFKRHTEEEFKMWLEEYSPGELWEKNMLGGRP